MRTLTKRAANSRFEPKPDELPGFRGVRSADLSLHAACLDYEGVTIIRSTIWLSSCATVGFDIGDFGTYPPVAEFSRESQALADGEPALLPEGSLVAEILADCAVVMRGQVPGHQSN